MATVITKAKEKNQIFGQSSKAMSQYVFRYLLPGLFN